MGRNALANRSDSTSCASSTSRRTLAVAPTTFAEGSALRNSCRARPSRMPFACSGDHTPP